MKFREHRGSLADSMATVVEISDRTALVSLLAGRLGDYGFEFADRDLVIASYGYDHRIDWDTHIVTIEGYGVAGFTDGKANN